MRRDRPGTILPTLVFTDIAGSTQIAEELGDRRRRDPLARQNGIVRRNLREYGGRELDTAGEGGVGLAPFYGLESRIPRRVRVELRRFEAEVGNRSIPIDPRTYLGT